MKKKFNCTKVHLPFFTQNSYSAKIRIFPIKQGFYPMKTGQPHQNDKKLLFVDASKFLIVNALTGNHNLCALPFY